MERTTKEAERDSVTHVHHLWLSRVVSFFPTSDDKGKQEK